MEIIEITNNLSFNFFASIGLWSAVIIAPIVVILSFFKN